MTQLHDATSRRKTTQLRALLSSPGTEFIMEAHNGLSARIVEEAGFKGIWGSGLSISAALGVRDNNEASWTQVLEVLEFMSDATSIPILMDGDTGFGNFNNMRRLVTKLEQRDIGGVAIEDKLFPKTNSFIGEGQPLADIEEFSGKIKAGKDSQSDDDFCIVARVEALIAGWGMAEALKRAEAYRQAGADAILIHSKKSTADEILTFTREWAGRSPLVIVPTTYAQTPTQTFRDAGVSLIIWANHNLRSIIGAMRDTSRRIFETESIADLEGAIPSVKDVFAIQNSQELKEAEDRYLPKPVDHGLGLILAASRGGALEHFTEDQPKSMLDIRGRPLLRRLVDTMRNGGIRDIRVVRGYKKEAIDFPDIDVVDNDRFMDTGEAWSLACAELPTSGALTIAYGDILFSPSVVEQMNASDQDVTLVVDADYARNPTHGDGRQVDLVGVSRPHGVDFLVDENEAPALVTALGDAASDAENKGEWIGLVRLSEAGVVALRAAIETMRADGTLERARLPDLLGILMARGISMRALYISGGWLDVDDAFDLAAARNFV
jgi:phosphoenolpyruvate phosphomutase